MLGVLGALVVKAPMFYPALLLCSGILNLLCHLIFDAKPAAGDKKKDDGDKKEDYKEINVGLSWQTGLLLIFIYFAILLALVTLKNFVSYPPLLWLEAFYRMGSMIFGGGQVLIPLMITEFSEKKWMAEQAILDGVALGQLLPGPMFNFVAYMGAVIGGVPGAIMAGLGIFTPGLIAQFAVLPFWNKFRSNVYVQPVMEGINAAAIGLVAAAFVMLWKKWVKTVAQECIAVVTITFVGYFGWAAPAGIIIGGLTGVLLHFTPIGD